MTSPASALSDLQGTIVLAGAGKMGGAMLSGWLAQGLDANRVAVIEPYPSDEIKALAAQRRAAQSGAERYRHASRPWSSR